MDQPIHSGLTDEEESEEENELDQRRPLVRNQTKTNTAPITAVTENTPVERDEENQTTTTNNPSSSTSSFTPSSHKSSSSSDRTTLPLELSEMVCGRMRLSFFNILCVSVGFCLLFTAFNTVQSYVTSLLPDGLGNISLTICYLTVVSTVVVTPLIVQLLGEPLSMTLGACCYCIYMASLTSLNPIVLYICSAILGVGGSILWVANGSYLTRCSEDHERGRNTGIFWTIFQSSTVIGNLAAYFIFTRVTSTQLFIILCLIGCAGASVLLFLKPLPARYYANEPFAKKPQQSPTTKSDYSSYSSNDVVVVTGLDEDEDGSGTLRNRDPNAAILPPHLPILGASVLLPPPIALISASPTVTSMAREVFALFMSPPILMLCPLFFFCGMEYSFWNGEFPQTLPRESIGLVLSVAGLMEVIGGTTLGLFSDRYGKGLTLIIGSVVYAIGLYVTSTHLMFQSHGTIKPDWLQVRSYAYFAAGCFGFADSAFNTQIYGFIGQHYSHLSTLVFTTFNFTVALGLSFGFGYQLYFPMHGSSGTHFQIWVQLLLLILATVGFLSSERYWKNQRLMGAQPNKPTTVNSSGTIQ